MKTFSDMLAEEEVIEENKELSLAKKIAKINDELEKIQKEMFKKKMPESNDLRKALEILNTKVLFSIGSKAHK